MRYSISDLRNLKGLRGFSTFQRQFFRIISIKLTKRGRCESQVIEMLELQFKTAASSSGPAMRSALRFDPASPLRPSSTLSHLSPLRPSSPSHSLTKSLCPLCVLRALRVLRPLCALRPPPTGQRGNC